MSTHPKILVQIRSYHANAGLGAALRVTRAAFESGQIDPLDMAEIFLALRSGSWDFFEEPGRIPREGRLEPVRAA